MERDIYTSGISHSQVMLSMHYLAIDTWDNETAYVKIDGVQVWSQVYRGSDGPDDVCGRPDGANDHRTLVMETRDHSGSIFQLKAGSNLNSPTSDESFGIDNVNVWIR